MNWARRVALLTLVVAVAACALPRSGPNKKEIFAGSVLNDGDAFVVSVNDRVTRATAVVPALGFSGNFVNAGALGSDTIRPGDVLGLTIYENVDDGLLVNPGQNATLLDEVQVDGAGFIFVPYAGRIRAAGNTPEAVRRIITSKLDTQTPDPQVLVRRLAGDGATVSVVGGVGAQGVYPIERPTRTLSSMIARASGSSSNCPRVVVFRSNLPAIVCSSIGEARIQTRALSASQRRPPAATVRSLKERSPAGARPVAHMRLPRRAGRRACRFRRCVQPPRRG